MSLISTRDIQSHLQEMYQVEVSHELIANVTDAMIDEAKAWQHRPLDQIYPILYLDAMVIKVKEGKQIVNKSLHMAMGVNMGGRFFWRTFYCNSASIFSNYWL